MNMNSISDQELFEMLRHLAKEERRITGEVLQLLHEVTKRRLHAKYGYDSLFSFLVKELGYDEGSAARRVNAIRVIEAVPETEQALAQGTLSIATVAQAQVFFQQEKKRDNAYSADEKREVLKKLENKSKREAERILAQEAPMSARPDQTRALNEAETEIRFTADAELLGMLEQIKALTPHQQIEPGYNGLFKLLAKQVLKKLDPARSTPSTTPGEAAPQQSLSRHVPMAVKREVWKRDDARCSYVSPKTGQRCGSRFGLQLDHRTPWAMGGETSVQNLRLLCREHNQLAAVEVYGERKISNFTRNP